MSKLSPVSFSDLVRKLKTLDFEGPFGGGKQTDSGVRPGWTGRSGLARECKLNKLFAYLWTSRFFTFMPQIQRGEAAGNRASV